MRDGIRVMLEKNDNRALEREFNFVRTINDRYMGYEETTAV